MQQPFLGHGAVGARHFLFVLLIHVALLTGGRALAYDGFTVGGGSNLPSPGAVVAVARIVYPFAEVARGDEALQFSVRGDVAYGLGVGLPPALAVSGVVSSDGDDGFPVERYLGVGTGVGFAGPGFSGASASLLFLAGGRVPLVERLSAAIEVQVAAAASFISPSLNLSLEYTLGGGW